MKDDDSFKEILDIVETMDTTISDKPTPMMFGVKVEDLFGGKMKQTIDKLAKREQNLMAQIAMEYYQAKILNFQGTQTDTYDFGTSTARFTAFEFIIRHGDPLTPEFQYKFEKRFSDLASEMGYKVRLTKE